MDFWVLEERDRFMREGEFACHYEIEEPLVVKASTKTCPSCGAVLEPGVWRPPHKIRTKSNCCGDLIQGAAFELIVSDAFRNGFEKAKLTGLTFSDPIQILPPRDVVYFAARPAVLVMRAQEDASEIVWRKPPVCEVCRLGVRKSTKRVILCEGEWSGDSIFVASGLYGVKLVSEEFVQMIHRYDLKNVATVRAEDYSEEIGV